jgi:secreted trypsin-like serine protease
MVLSAGHVLPPSPEGMKLYVGSYAVGDDNLDGVAGKIKQAWIHPKYSTINNDFAVFHLDYGDTDYSSVKVVRINRNASLPNDGQAVTMLGTGTFNLTTSERPKVLQKGISRIVSSTKCSKAYDPERGISYVGMIDETNFCSMGKQDGCVFDSGGPIIVPGKSEKDDVLVGLISFGLDCADPVYPAVNARVSAVHTWIDQLVCQHSINPPEDFDCSSRLNRRAETAFRSTTMNLFRQSFLLLAMFGIAFITFAVIVLLKRRQATPTRTCDDQNGGEHQALLQTAPKSLQYTY